MLIVAEELEILHFLLKYRHKPYYLRVKRISLEVEIEHHVERFSLYILFACGTGALSIFVILRPYSAKRISILYSEPVVCGSDIQIEIISASGVTSGRFDML